MKRWLSSWLSVHAGTAISLEVRYRDRPTGAPGAVRRTPRFGRGCGMGAHRRPPPRQPPTPRQAIARTLRRALGCPAKQLPGPVSPRRGTACCRRARRARPSRRLPQIGGQVLLQRTAIGLHRMAIGRAGRWSGRLAAVRQAAGRPLKDQPSRSQRGRARRLPATRSAHHT